MTEKKEDSDRDTDRQIGEADRRHAELLIEYQQLREEIRHNQGLGQQILGGSLLLVATLTAVALSDAVKDWAVKGVIFLLANAVVAIASTQRAALTRTSWRIASYLVVFVESELFHARYETRLAQLRARRSSRPTVRRALDGTAASSSGRFLFFATIAATWGAAAYALIWPSRSDVGWNWLFGGLALIALAVIDAIAVYAYYSFPRQAQHDDATSTGTSSAEWRAVQSAE